MLVDSLRSRVIERLREVASLDDEEEVARVLTFSRALLLALASHVADAEVDVEALTVKTGTAARILDLHPEYVRELVRKRDLPARKQNGEFNITLSDIVNYQGRSQRPRKPGHAYPTVTVGVLGGWEMWRRLPEQPQAT
jgi:hypothetical protein